MWMSRAGASLEDRKGRGGRKLVGVEGGAGEGVGRVGGMFDEISPAVGKVLVFYSQWADAERFEARK